MSDKKSRLVYSLAAMAAVVALQAPAVATAETTPAQTQADRSDRYAEPQKGERKHHARAQKRDIAFMIPGYGAVGQKTLEALNLTDDQKQKIEAAQAEQKAFRSAHRSEMKSVMQTRLKQLQEGNIDPRAAESLRQTTHEKMAQQRSKVADKWLEAWDTLDKEQQKVLSKALADRYEHRKSKMRAHSAS